MDAETFLVLDKLARRITVRKLRIPHPDDEISLSSSKTVEKGEVVGYYYGSPVYFNLNKERRKTKTYEEVLMQVSTETFRKYANEVQEKKVDKDGIDRRVSVVPAPFRAMRDSNDATYVPAGTTQQSKRLNKRAGNNVQFLQGR